ncbi:hypothetical protein GH714_016502 [Hevea brasiliensis]|uniref:Uncharacterized protein n=1 Tax=Hevea brasiliensis TaxID=3981 RepID=A0A6A6MAM8_HEVBR|nr:hypothetical protein GH714_016502 [Hevea brasiliensis]
MIKHLGDRGSGQNANVEKCDNAMMEEDEENDDYFIQMEEQKLASESELDVYLEELLEKFTLDFDLLWKITQDPEVMEIIIPRTRVDC